jgi:hypothetical protein
VEVSKTARESRFDYFLVEPLPVAEPRLGRRTVLTLPLLPPPQKNRSPPSDSSPETLTPGGMSSVSRTSPVRGSTRRKSLWSPSQVPCHSSPSIHRDGGEHSAGLRVDLLDAIRGELEQVLAVEGRSRIRRDLDRAQCLSGRRVEGSACLQRQTRRADRHT